MRKQASQLFELNKAITATPPKNKMLMWALEILTPPAANRLSSAGTCGRVEHKFVRRTSASRERDIVAYEAFAARRSPSWQPSARLGIPGSSKDAASKQVPKFLTRFVGCCGSTSMLHGMSVN
ncbi:hypothetical protein MINTM020_01060 [Mycobacterium paraintracellulare]|nr:hypothetical protein MINTM020_01060 [Mycobacterium paraintracellulare]